eukprot:s11_g65.t1
MKWNKCWGNAIIGKGLEHGEVHGCMTYTHTYGARNRFMEFSRPILKDNKPAGLLVRLQNGVPVINGANSLNGLKVVDVVGWAPTADTLALAENKCTKERFTGFTIIQPTDALATLMNGDADAMWVYADQAKNYQCTDGVTANWDCDLWAGFGTTFAYIQTGLFGHAMAGTTLAMSKKGSGLAEILNPCIDKFIVTKDYYDICVKHGFDDSCFPNEFFPATEATDLVWEKPTDELTTTCADPRRWLLPLPKCLRCASSTGSTSLVGQTDRLILPKADDQRIDKCIDGSGQIGVETKAHEKIKWTNSSK